jgi:hypothetical protein
MQFETGISKFSASKEASFSAIAASAALGASLMKRLKLRKEHNIGF